MSQPANERDYSDLTECAILAIRKMLYSYGIPTAAYIDDHVGNMAVYLNQMFHAVNNIELATGEARNAAVLDAIGVMKQITEEMALTRTVNLQEGLIDG